MNVEWLDAPEDHDYQAAAQYLSLIDDNDRHIHDLVALLRGAQTDTFFAKDILRASQLVLLPEDNAHVVKDINKVKDGKHLSPVLLIRGRVGVAPLVIADGYHRVCAAYHIDENAPISCRIV